MYSNRASYAVGKEKFDIITFKNNLSVCYKIEHFTYTKFINSIFRYICLRHS